MGGPVADKNRAQPANLLQDGKSAVLVDAGDGAVDQLTKAGVDLAAVGTVILSHLHIDHTAGLYGILGRRLQEQIPGALKVYGPPGTQQVVTRMTAAQQYLRDLLEADTSSQGGGLVPTSAVVVEVTDGSTFTVGGASVTAATNSHYGFAAGTADAARFQSLSYRFDLPHRSIAFTGDTGPSMEPGTAGPRCRPARQRDHRPRPGTGGPQGDPLQHAAERRSFSPQPFRAAAPHADAVGKLAEKCGVGAVVLTHNPMNDNGIQRAGDTITSLYSGRVAFAADLDTC